VRAARLAFIFLASVWIVLLVAAPVAGLGGLVSGLTYALGSLICHQRPERSFYIDAAQLPVCARCLGLYAGAALGVLISGLTPTVPPFDVARLRRGLVAAAVPTAITWSSEMFGLWSPGNLTRFIAALPLGAAVAVTVNYIECARRQRTGPRSPRIHI
jgi:uncharacterized membrane protein